MDDIVTFIDDLRSSRHFDAAAASVLRRLLQISDETLASSEYRESGKVLRGMVHLRPAGGYLGLATLENGARGITEPGPEVSYMPSATVWRCVEEHRLPAAVEVNLGLINVQDRVIQDTPIAHTKPFDSDLSIRAFMQRDTTHVLALPLISVPGTVVGMICIEVGCPRAMGKPFIWPQCMGKLQLFSDIATPYLLSVPMRTEGPAESEPFLPVIGKSTRLLTRLLRGFARQEETILIRGPTGVGKSRLARWCHACSPRHEHPFEVVDLLAVPEDMQLAELFGWKKGAFTGAVRDHTGGVGRAEGGTLFIDEIDKLSLNAQAGLLHLVEERRYRALGDSASHRNADIRFIVASNIDLGKAVGKGEFRQDLYYRINVLPVTIPPLEQRPDEIPLWARYMLERQAEEARSGQPSELTAGAITKLVARSWPGNLRQLDNVIRRASAIARAELDDDNGALQIQESHIESSLMFEEIDSKGGLTEAVAAAAAAFVAESERLSSKGEPLDLDLADAFRGMVLLAAVKRFGSSEEAFRILGKEKLVLSRNHHKALKRAVVKVAELHDRLSVQLDEQVAQLVDD